MPNPGLEEPVKKITINIFFSDYKSLIQRYGAGWSGEVRELIRRYIRKEEKDDK